MRKPFVIAACALAGLGAAGVAVAEVAGTDAVDEHVVREPVRKVVIDAQEGDVTLVRSADDVQVRVRRSHVVNTPSTSREVSGDVLTLRTTCPIGFVPCTSDLRVGVPAGVVVTVDKPSGHLDAAGVGGEVTELTEDVAPLTLTAR
jgi:hypothetical protein